MKNASYLPVGKELELIRELRHLRALVAALREECEAAYEWIIAPTNERADRWKQARAARLALDK